MNISNEQSYYVEKLIHGGLGLSRTQSGIVFIRGGITGETVIAYDAGSQGGVAIKNAAEIVLPSSFRRSPLCEHFGSCGGCDWQFITYNGQIQFKKDIFIESLQRTGKIDEFPSPSIIAAQEFGYRRRAQIKISDTGQAGFFKRTTNTIVCIKQCVLLTKRINDLLSHLYINPLVASGSNNSIKVIDGEALVSDPPLNGYTVPSTNIRCGSIVFNVQGSDFIQGNRFLLEALAEQVTSFCSGAKLVDLYGGVGFFSMMLAKKVTQAWLIEIDRTMVRRAEKNFKKNGITNIKAIAGPAEKLEKLVPVKPDVLLVDPPRPGLTRKVREAIKQLFPDRIIYVSCDCATQARDAGFFVKNGYRIISTVLVDLYPNTYHTETILVMDRK